MDDYYNSTGLIWQHYYGPDGPRGPPTMYMWPAKKVSDVHVVGKLRCYNMNIYLYIMA